MRKALLLACAATLMTVVPVARAALSINGDIGFTGGYTANGTTGGRLNTATTMSINNISVASANGALIGAVSPHFFSPIVVNGNENLLVGDQLWSVIVSGATYTFTVDSATQTFASDTQLNLAGTGTMNAPGFDPTPGVWQLGFGVSGDSFTWQSTAAVPEPTTCLAGALMLLPFAASTIRSLRRKG